MRTRGRALAVGAACSALLACQSDLAPYAEVVLIVDTDLPVPALAARLRADVFASDGTWLSTDDFGLSTSREWPASFSVVSRDEQEARDVLVRLRAYPEGKLRDYRGERFAPRATFMEPPVATSLAELCAAPPQLALGEPLTLRRGADAITSLVKSVDCPNTPLSGAAAARVEISEAGSYRFEVTATDGFDATLLLRTDCAEVDSQVACHDDVNALTGDFTPRLVVELQPGAYTLVATAWFPWQPANMTVLAKRAEVWDDPPPAEPPPVPPPDTPRLVVDGIDMTPPTEPQPLVTVDRLVRLHLEPGRVGAARVVLRGACLGTMSRLAAAPSLDRPVLAEAETCLDVENARQPLAEEPLDDDLDATGPSEQGRFGAGDGCPESAGGDVVCIPGGLFVLGGTFGQTLDLGSLPERVAVISRFWIDRNEVTVARLRAAVAGGLEFPRFGPLSAEQPDIAAVQPYCTWTARPGGMEDHAVSCVAWEDARAFCQWSGGDLPTEAQWEYVASAADRPFETRYPWGDLPPTCDQAVFARYDGPASSGAAEAACVFGPGDDGPLPVEARATTDVTSLGVVNLGGGHDEWTRDSAQAYDGPCWNAAGLVDPICWEEHAPRHNLRGGSFRFGITSTRTNQRLPLQAFSPAEQSGFRCVYQAPP